MKTVVSFFALVGFALMAQQESTRQLWNEEFMKQRPASKAKPAANPQQPDKRSTLVGVTLWRLRAPSPKDSGGTRLLVLDKTGAASGHGKPTESNKRQRASDSIGRRGRDLYPGMRFEPLSRGSSDIILSSSGREG